MPPLPQFETSVCSSGAFLWPKASKRPLLAFTLVEIVMALGIVGVSFVSLLGIIPIGMNTFTSAMDATVELQIAQGIIANARQGKFSELDALANSPVYFDEQGQTGGQVSANNYIYCARVQVFPNSDVLVGSSPSSTSTSLGSANVTTIVVSVGKISPVAGNHVFTAFIANNGL